MEYIKLFFNDFPKELRNKFRGVCNYRGTTMKARIIQFMEEEVQRFEKEIAKKTGRQN